jgi:Ca2+-binding EF-hand superfamily protein
MSRGLMLVLTACLMSVVPAHAADQAQQQPRKIPPAFQLLLRGGTEKFMQHFDKNKDGYLTRDEVPPALAAQFDRVDRNGDGRLDREEIEQLLQVLRRRFGAEAAKNPPAAGQGNPDQVVRRWLERMDTNKDGKVSREEAQGPLARFFDQFDTNKDGFLDRQELRRAAARIVARQAGNGGNGGPQPEAASRPAGPDFDALDANADGRLTREELKGTPFAEHFDEIDTNKDGKIDRKEFAAYLKKQGAGK